MRRRTERILYNLFDVIIIILCLPFYAVVVPIRVLYEMIIVRVSKIRPGAEISHWINRERRQELLVVDISRIDDGVVGVRRRVYWRNSKPPPFDDAIEYCTISEFWFGPNRLLH
jgi:hypothetical protein